MQQNNYEKYERLLFLAKYFNLSDLISPNGFNLKDVESYYRHTKLLFYKSFASKQGFMHVGLSEDGKYSKDSGYELHQVDIIQSMISKTNAQDVLEIGCGQCANLKHLADRFSGTKFYGVDLAPTFRGTKRYKNISINTDDYHVLSAIEDNSVDLAFAIETLCYSEKKEVALEVIYRKLKPNGRLIIFDIFLGVDRSNLSDIDNVLLNILENSYKLNHLEKPADFSRKIAFAGLSCLEAQEMSLFSLPYLAEIEARMRHYLQFEIFIKILLFFYPRDVKHSMPPGLLMKQMVEDGYLQYWMYEVTKGLIDEK